MAPELGNDFALLSLSCRSLARSASMFFVSTATNGSEQEMRKELKLRMVAFNTNSIHSRGGELSDIAEIRELFVRGARVCFSSDLARIVFLRSMLDL